MANAPVSNAPVSTSNVAANEAAKTAEKARDYVMLAISVPPELAKMFEDEASKSTPKVSVQTIGRRALASHFSFNVAPFESTRKRGRVKYASEEEKLAAIRESQQTRAATVNALMAMYKSGKIQLSEDAIEAAKSEAKPRKPRKV